MIHIGFSLVDSKRENTDESNIFKENIIKEMFSESFVHDLDFLLDKIY